MAIDREELKQALREILEEPGAGFCMAIDNEQLKQALREIFVEAAANRPPKVSVLDKFRRVFSRPNSNPQRG